ncbi:GNAT family N-acetyltransferase [Gammaproteobacteria bacterium]|nr:GNAT family N-acetyltransferase [Gammaproteobacteria bacterium]
MITARLASETDSMDLLDWRNDPITLKSFFNQRIIEKEDHEKWYGNILSSEHSMIIILEINKRKIGMVRYDKKRADYYVSLNTNPIHRGKGYASEMLVCSERFIDSGKEEIKIVADILIDNKISIRTFTSAGYKFAKRKENFFRYIKMISN